MGRRVAVRSALRPELQIFGLAVSGYGVRLHPERSPREVGRLGHSDPIGEESGALRRADLPERRQALAAYLALGVELDLQDFQRPLAGSIRLVPQGDLRHLALDYPGRGGVGARCENEAGESTDSTQNM